MSFQTHLKKRILTLFLMLSLLLLTFTGCSGSTKTSPGGSGTKVVLNEVAHSIFYAPMYAAVEEGYFADAGIELQIVTGFGADKTMTAVLSGEADIGFMGPETTVYACNEGAADVVVNFAQLTQRAGNFLVAREPMENFSWSDLKGKNVLGGRAGGMPSHDVTWEHIRGIYEWDSPVKETFILSFVVILRQIRKQNPKIIPSAIENSVNVHVLPIHTVKNHVISTGEKSVVAFYICHRGQRSADF